MSMQVIYDEVQALELFDEYLDGCSSPIEIAGVSQPYSYALKEMDPTAYDCAFADWASENQVEGYF
tara:strand:+ start:93 stop:290 length:198 start_codon:yes stop_codon:yes gene_type:complete